EVVYAIETQSISYHALIKIKIDGELIETTAGRILLNEALPPEMEFVNQTLGDKELRALISKVYDIHGSAVTVRMLDAVKEMGFKYATIFGATIGVGDILVPEVKSELMAAANNEVVSIQNQYLQGHITHDERYNRVIEVWSKTNEDLTNQMMEKLKADRQGFNPVFM